MEQIPLGSPGLIVSRQGLGCMGMSEFYGTGDDDESIATIHRALSLGVTFFDTADMYGPFTNEVLLGRASERAATRRSSPPNSATCAIPTIRPDAASTAGRSTCARPATRRSSGSGPTTSISTTSTGSTPTRRSRRRSGRWASLCRRARCATSGYPRRHRPLFAAPTPCTRFRRCRPSTRSRRAIPRPRSCPRSTRSGSGSCPTARSGAVFSPLRSLDQLEKNDFRRHQPRLSVTPRGQLRHRRADRRAGVRPGLPPAQVALAWVHAEGREPRPHPRHEASSLSRREHRCAGRRTEPRRLGTPSTVWPRRAVSATPTCRR